MVYRRFLLRDLFLEDDLLDVLDEEVAGVVEAKENPGAGAADAGVPNAPVAGAGAPNAPVAGAGAAPNNPPAGAGAVVGAGAEVLPPKLNAGAGVDDPKPAKPVVGAVKRSKCTMRLILKRKEAS